jgi:hypothetical protein
MENPEGLHSRERSAQGVLSMGLMITIEMVAYWLNRTPSYNRLHFLPPVCPQAKSPPGTRHHAKRKPGP